MLKYSSGNIFNDKFKFNLTAERKAGDYYIRGTEYDGWSFGFETENKFKNRVVNTSFIAAPQSIIKHAPLTIENLENFSVGNLAIRLIPGLKILCETTVIH